MTLRSKKETVVVERFRTEVQYAIQRIMMDRGISQAELAGKLGFSRARMSQILSPRCNLTIRSMARIFHALDDRCYVMSDRFGELVQSGHAPSFGKDQS